MINRTADFFFVTFENPKFLHSSDIEYSNCLISRGTCNEISIRRPRKSLDSIFVLMSAHRISRNTYQKILYRIQSWKCCSSPRIPEFDLIIFTARDKEPFSRMPFYTFHVPTVTWWFEVGNTALHTWYSETYLLTRSPLYFLQMTISAHSNHRWRLQSVGRLDWNSALWWPLVTMSLAMLWGCSCWAQNIWWYHSCP